MRVAVVNGAGRVIGAAIARKAARPGYRVEVWDPGLTKAALRNLCPEHLDVVGVQ